MNFGPPELIIILLIVLVLFGGSKLPKLARSMGQAQKEFKQGLAEGGKGAEGAEGAEGDDGNDGNDEKSSTG